MSTDALPPPVPRRPRAWATDAGYAWRRFGQHALPAAALRDADTETLQRTPATFARLVRAMAHSIRKSARELGAWARARSRTLRRDLFDAAIAAREARLYRLSSARRPATRRSRRATSTGAQRTYLAARAPAAKARDGTKDTALWRVAPAAPEVASLLAPVLWSAGDLIAGTRSTRVRLCANERCRWLFLDDSKSGTRRWCSMSSCGKPRQGAPALHAEDWGRKRMNCRLRQSGSDTQATP